MHGFKPAQAAQYFAKKTQPRAGYAQGGMVRGPGTGTSDEVPDQVPEGSYIMPADSTRALGAPKLQGLGIKNIPVNLSNGEFKLPPEQVHAVGVQALDQMKNATHKPVSKAAGLKPEMFFSNGGTVRDPNRPDIPVVGTRGPVRGAGGGGLSRDAVVAAQNEQRTNVPAAAGIAGLMANPVTSPQGITRERMRMAGAGNYADGGVVAEDEKRRSGQVSPNNTYPQASPSAGANMYGGAGVKGLGSSGLPASGIGAQPPKPQAPAGISMASQNTDAQQSAVPAKPAVLQTDPQAAADRAAIGGAWSAAKGVSEDAGRAILDVATMVPRGVMGAYDSAVVRPMRAAGINAGYLSQHLVPDGVEPSSMTPFTDQKRMQQPAPAPAAASTAAPGAQAGAGAGRGVIIPPMAEPSNPLPQPGPANAPFGTEVMAGVYQHGRGQYSDSAAGMGMPAGFTGQPNAQNMAAAQALSDRGQQQTLASGFNPRAPEAQPGFSGVIGQQLGIGNMWSRSPEQQRRDAEVQASSIHGKTAAMGNAALKGLDGRELEAMRNAAGTEQAAMRENGATARTQMQEVGQNSRFGQAQGLAQQKFGMEQEAQGFSNRAAAQSEQLRNRIMQEQDPAKRQSAVQQMRELSGTQQADPYLVVPGGQQVDETGKPYNMPSSVFNRQTQQFVQQPAQGGAQPSANHLAALRANPKQAANFDQVYGAGAAKRALGQS